MNLRTAALGLGTLAVIVPATFSNGLAAGPPAINDIAPSSGAASGETQITVAGSGFAGATDLLYTPAPSNAGPSDDITAVCPSQDDPGDSACFFVDSDSQITAVTPAHPDATMVVQVRTSAGTSSSTGQAGVNEFTFSGQPTPAAASVSPHSGPTAGGTQITITPQTSPGNYSFATAVDLGSTQITTTPCPSSSPSDCFTVVNDSDITAYVPASPSPADDDAPVDVTVTTGGGTSPVGANAYWVWASQPTVTSDSGGGNVPPHSGGDGGGTELTVTGTHFESSSLPGYSVGSVQFINTTNSSDVATVGPCSGNPPFVGCFSPQSQTTLDVYTPATPNDDATFYIQVTTPGGSSATPTAAEYTSEALSPDVTAVTPDEGNADGGYSLVVMGGGGGGSYTSVSSVHVGAALVTTTPCPSPVVAPCFTVNSADQLTLQDLPSAQEATAPTAPTAVQTIDVRVQNTTGESSANAGDEFTYYAPATVSSVTPSSRAQGTTTADSVSGTNFNAVSAVELTPVSSSTGSGIDITGACGASVTSDCFTTPSTTSLSFSPPATAPTGAYTVQVVTPAGNSTLATDGSDTFTVTVVAPTVSAVSPDAGPTGGLQAVTVSGGGFSGSGFTTSQVSFGATAVTSQPCPASPSSPCLTVSSPTEITVYTPTSSTGNDVVNVTVEVAANDGSSTATSAAASADSYEYAAAPTVTGLSSSSGTTAGGTQVQVRGTNFEDQGSQLYTTSAVSFGATVVTTSPCPGSNPSDCFTVTSATSITVYAPPHAQGVVDVTVTTPGGTSATGTPDHFLYVAPRPAVASVSPDQGPAGGGTAVTIGGSAFTAATALAFGSTSVTTSPCPGGSPSDCYTVINDTTIDAYTPSHSAATVDVEVTTAGGTSAANAGDAFTYLDLPAVTGLSQSTGPIGGGNGITVSGSSFTTAQSVNLVASSGTVRITTICGGGTPSAPCFTVTNDGSISVEDLPAVSKPETVNVTVTNAVGTSPTSSGDQYTYVQPAPTVAGISPGSGAVAGMTEVTISGSHFTGTGYAAASVSFGSAVVTSSPCPGSPSQPCFTVNSASSISAYTPSHVQGQVDVTVTTAATPTDASPDQTSPTSSADVYAYVPSPAVGSVSPNVGSTNGLTSVTVTGASFSGAGFTTESVQVGGSSVTSTPCPATPSSACFTVSSSTSLLVITPPHAAGAVDITVTTAGGTSATSGADEFLYVAPGVFTPVQQYRILDTRSHSCLNCGPGALQAGEARTVNLSYTGPEGQQVPADALAVAVNVTAVDASAPTFITVYPTGQARSLTSVLDTSTSAAIPDLVVAAVGSDDTITVYNHAGTVDILIDVEGWFLQPTTSTPAGQFHAMSPVRVCDTRTGTGTPCSGSSSDNLLGAGAVRKVDLTGLSASATAAALNLTAVSPTSNTYLSVMVPDAQDACPTANNGSSDLDVAAGATQPNRVLTELGPDQDICVYNFAGSLNIAVDVNGWFGGAGDTTGTQFYATAPMRVCDTRAAYPGCSTGALGAGGVRTVSMTPAGQPVAVLLTLTAVSPSASTYFSLYPAAASRPLISDLDPAKGQTIANLAIVETSGAATPAWSVDLYNFTGSAEAVFDVAGWFQ